MMFPPLNETTFSEQYKTFKALGGQRRPPMGNLEMSKDLKMRIMPAAANKPYYKRNIRGPALDNAIGHMMPPPGLAMPGAEQSVFQANASHVLSSPGTFNMMADATTAPYPYDASLMRNAMSPNGKFRILLIQPNCTETGKENFCSGSRADCDTAGADSAGQ